MVRFHPNPTQAAVWRQRADRLRALARVTRERKAQLELLELAQQWDAMARLASGPMKPQGITTPRDPAPPRAQLRH